MLSRSLGTSGLQVSEPAKMFNYETSGDVCCWSYVYTEDEVFFPQLTWYNNLFLQTYRKTHYG